MQCTLANLNYLSALKCIMCSDDKNKIHIASIFHTDILWILKLLLTEFMKRILPFFLLKRRLSECPRVSVNNAELASA